MADKTVFSGEGVMIMKLFKSLLVMLLVFGCVCGCTKKNEEEEVVFIPTPFTEEKSLEAAEEKVGFELTLPAGFKPNYFQAYEDGMLHAEVFEGDESVAYIRKAPLNKEFSDISGDYNEYDKTEDVVMAGQNVTIRMTKGKVYVANWRTEEYSYCIGCTAGMTVDEVIDFVEQIH